LRGPAHGAASGGYGLWLLTVIVRVFVVLTLTSGKFYPLLQSPVRPIDRHQQPALYWLIVACMLAAMAASALGAIWMDRRFPISWPVP